MALDASGRELAEIATAGAGTHGARARRMKHLGLLLSVLCLLQSCVCAINPGLEMWNSNEHEAPNACMPFAADGGVGSGVVTGATSFVAPASHHFSYSPSPATGLKFLQLQLDEAGTTCHLSSQADANTARGLRSVLFTLVAPADAGWAGTYEVSGVATDGGRTGRSSIGAGCRPFLGLLGDCSTPSAPFTGTVTLESVSACAMAGRFELIDLTTDAGSSGRFSSVYCRGID